MVLKENCLTKIKNTIQTTQNHEVRCKYMYGKVIQYEADLDGRKMSLSNCIFVSTAGKAHEPSRNMWNMYGIQHVAAYTMFEQIPYDSCEIQYIRLLLAYGFAMGVGANTYLFGIIMMTQCKETTGLT